MLHQDLNSTEVQAAFLYEMLELDLTDWHPGDVPESEGLREQRYLSMDSHQQWLAESLINGSFYIDGEERGWIEEVSTKQLFSSYVRWCDTARKGVYSRIGEAALSKYLGQLQFVHKKRVNGQDKRGLAFGTLDEAVEKFEKHERIKLDEIYQ